MKIVINKCFGGYGLSPEAVKMLAELKGTPCYFFNHHYEGRKSIYTLTENPSTSFWRAFTVKDPENYNYNDICFDAEDIPRDDPLLVKVVEKLGEKADGSYAKLEVVKIPEGVDWEIDEYDGMESVSEKHRTWG